jgi:hypothetical protein
LGNANQQVTQGVGVEDVRVVHNSDRHDSVQSQLLAEHRQIIRGRPSLGVVGSFVVE